MKNTIVEKGRERVILCKIENIFIYYLQHYPQPELLKVDRMDLQKGLK